MKNTFKYKHTSVAKWLLFAVMLLVAVNTCVTVLQLIQAFDLYVSVSRGLLKLVLSAFAFVSFLCVITMRYSVGYTLKLCMLGMDINNKCFKLENCVSVFTKKINSQMQLFCCFIDSQNDQQIILVNIDKSQFQDFIHAVRQANPKVIVGNE